MAYDVRWPRRTPSRSRRPKFAPYHPLARSAASERFCGIVDRAGECRAGERFIVNRMTPVGRSVAFAHVLLQGANREELEKDPTSRRDTGLLR